MNESRKTQYVHCTEKDVDCSKGRRQCQECILSNGEYIKNKKVWQNVKSMDSHAMALEVP